MRIRDERQSSHTDGLADNAAAFVPDVCRNGSDRAERVIRGWRRNYSPMSAAMLIVVHPTGGFEFGWDSLVAIATGVLAAITACLASSTRQLARETGEDVRAGIRPVLIDPGGGGPDVQYEEKGSGRCVITLQNVGPGPALNVKLSLRAGEETEWQLASTIGPGSPPSQWTIKDIPKIDILGKEHQCRIVCVYEDLAKGRYRTELFYRIDQVAERTVALYLESTVVTTIAGPPRQSRRKRRRDRAEADRARCGTTRAVDAHRCRGHGRRPVVVADLAASEVLRCHARSSAVGGQRDGVAQHSCLVPFAIRVHVLHMSYKQALRFRLSPQRL